MFISGLPSKQVLHTIGKCTSVVRRSRLLLMDFRSPFSSTTAFCVGDQAVVLSFSGESGERRLQDEVERGQSYWR